MRVVHVAGTRHDEAHRRSMRPGGRDEVTRSLEVGAPDQVGVGRAKHRGEMDDRRDAGDGLDQRGGIEDIAGNRRARGCGGPAGAHERAAVETGFDETRHEARSDQSARSGDEDRHVSAPLPDSRSSRCTARSSKPMVVAIAEGSSPSKAAR